MTPEALADALSRSPDDPAAGVERVCADLFPALLALARGDTDIGAAIRRGLARPGDPTGLRPLSWTPLDTHADLRAILAGESSAASVARQSQPCGGLPPSRAVRIVRAIAEAAGDGPDGFLTLERIDIVTTNVPGEWSARLRPGALGVGDPRDDVSELGLILVRLMLGRPDADAADARGFLRLPPRQSCPADLKRVLRSCLRESPAQRFPTPAALARALGRVRERCDWAAADECPEWPVRRERLAAARQRYADAEGPFGNRDWWAVMRAAHASLSWCPAVAGAYRLEATAEFALTQHAFARRNAIRATLADPGDRDARLLAAESLLHLDRPREALAEAQVLRLDLGDPWWPRLWTVLGEAHRMLRDAPAAVEWLRRAAEADPDRAVGRSGLGAALCLAERWAEARAELEAGVRLGYDTSWDRGLLSRVARGLGEPAEALSQAIAATEMDSRNAWAWWNLGECHRQAGRWDDARSAFEHCIAVRGDLALGWGGLAETCHDAGDWPGVLALLDRAAAAGVESESWPWYRRHAQARLAE